MNIIYSLRYSVVARGFIAVSEFARKCTCRVTGKKHLKVSALLLSPLLLSVPVGASIVSSEIDYQIFSDFAENKGAFRPGATDITINNKQRELVGTLNKAAMLDFSSVNVKSNPGVATLINPQYVASVKHNGGYQNVSFGDGENRYNIVDRNEHGSQDFHAPRLDKLVIGIFCTIHTYGRRLNWHPHVHVSVTCGGIDAHGKWKKINFRKDAMRARWMWNIRQWLLSVWSEGVALPPSLSYITTGAEWRSQIMTDGGDY